MNPDTLQNIAAKLFPEGTVNGRGGVEINGLPAGSQPQNCEVLLRGAKENSRGERREFYLVQCDAVMLYLRICTAMEGSGYDEFVVIHEVAEIEEKRALKDRAARMMSI